MNRSRDIGPAAIAEVVGDGQSTATVRQLHLVGEFDASNIDQLESALSGDGLSTIVLDLTETTFIDSQFIGLLAVGYRDGMRIIVRGANGIVRRALDLAGAATFLTIEP